MSNDSNENYKVWTCSVIVPENAKLPEKKESFLRHAIQKALKDEGIDLLYLTSQWLDGEVNHGDEDEYLDSLTKAEEPYDPGPPDDTSGESYEDISHGS